MVEFALAAVLLFVVVFSIIEFGRAIWMYGTIAHVAKEGTRFAIVHGSDSASPATAADVEAYVKNAAANVGDLVVTTTWADPSKDPGTVVTVQVQRPFVPRIPFIDPGSITLSSSSQMVISF